MIYLDHSATTRPLPQAVDAMAAALGENFGNPSSLHGLGVAAERSMQAARESIARALQAQPQQIVFTSGATEADNLAIFGAVGALRRRGKRIVTTAVEHPAVLECCRQLEAEGFEVVQLRPRDGRIRSEQVFEAVTADTVLVSMMAVNNETGDRLPLDAVAPAIRRAGAPALFHCDGVQAFGKQELYPDRLGIDLLALSAHKLYGPKGVGALYVRRGARILPRLFGGGQERGMRSGTENVPGIVGFAAAVDAVFPKRAEIEARMAALRRRLLAGVADMPQIVINSPEDGAPHIVNLSVLGCRSEIALHFLEERGIYVSSGSACSSKSAKRARVLEAYGLPPARYDSALRISFGMENSERDVDELIEALRACVCRFVKR